jgi:hypothetical protein
LSAEVKAFAGELDRIALLGAASGAEQKVMKNSTGGHIDCDLFVFKGQNIEHSSGTLRSTHVGKFRQKLDFDALSTHPAMRYFWKPHFY